MVSTQHSEVRSDHPSHLLCSLITRSTHTRAQHAIYHHSVHQNFIFCFVVHLINVVRFPYRTHKLMEHTRRVSAMANKNRRSIVKQRNA